MARALVLAVLVLLLAAAPLGASLAPPPAASAPATVSPELAARLAQADLLPIIVRFDTVEDVLAFVPELDGRAALPIRSLPGLAFSATAEEVARLAARPGVAYVELDAPLPVLLPTATQATRAASVWSGGQTLVDADGRVIDGTGIGVAVIDTGVDARHPALADNVALNMKVVGPRMLVSSFYQIFFSNDPSGALPELFVEVQDSDVGGGHGTHVAGIVAANGGSDLRGAAPGASIYAFGTGAGLSLVTSSVAASWDWILLHHDDVSPPIRVVTNSYGNVGAWNPENAVARLATKAIEQGMVVVWAAGNGDRLNDGGTGDDDRLTVYAHQPTPGAITVANYDDGGTGTRDGTLDSSSSRGLRTDPSTWPDVSAPGSDILSTRATTDPLVVLSGGVFETDGNVFGNAINQFRMDVVFEVGGKTSPRADFNFILPFRPAVAYNAHSGRLVAGAPAGVLVGPDAEGARDLRFFAPVAAPLGPLHPEDGAARVAPGDRIVFTKTGGTAHAPSLIVTAPDGTAVDLVLRIPCDAGCTATLDLHALFPDAPSEGTWSVVAGRTARAERAAAIDWIEYSGTSMAAPHVAGIVALMLQADPSLSPADVERLVESTAYKFVFGGAYAPDPAHPGGTSSFDKGHGLVDARAAVLAALG